MVEEQQEGWYVVRAKARRETFASCNVHALGIEILLPKMRTERLVRGVPEPVIKAVFPGYFFARFCPGSLLDAVEHSHGVLHVVKSGRLPIPVPEPTIRDIQRRMDQHSLVRISRPTLKAGDRISIQTGPFEGLMGRVERELNDRRRVEILLENLLNAKLCIEKRWLEPAA